MISIEGDDIELKLIQPIYKSRRVKIKDETGKKVTVSKKILHKEIRVSRWFRKHDVVSVQEYITSRNTVATNRCLILDNRTNQFYAVSHSISEVRSALKPKPIKNQIGFNHVSKI